MPSQTLLLAHLSDVHLAPMPRLRPGHATLKRALGAANWHRRRQHVHVRAVLDAIVADLKAQRPEHILVTGDLVANSAYLEFETPEGGRKVPAAVEFVDYEANLDACFSERQGDANDLHTRHAPYGNCRLQEKSSYDSKVGLHQVYQEAPITPNHAMERTADRCALHF